MKNYLLHIAAVYLGVLSVAVAQQSKPPIYPPGAAKLTINLIHEDGSPVENAKVGVSFNQTQNYWQEGHKFDTKDFQTGKTGVVIAEGETTSGWINYGATKEGYYRSVGERLILERKDTRYEPWNPTVELVLKPIVNPIPMVARRLDAVQVPVVGKVVGFDLMESDWVAPHGKGKVADLLFNLEKQYTSVDQPFEVTLTVRFSNEDDGIQSVLAPINVGSELRLPRNAPESGYLPELIKSNSRKSSATMIQRDYRDDQNYFFRVRTVKKDGKIVNAHYGKIDRDIEFWGNEKLRFTYYLNATPNDRNMEFDPKRNLLKGLKDAETVTNP